MSKSPEQQPKAQRQTYMEQLVSFGPSGAMEEILSHRAEALSGAEMETLTELILKDGGNMRIIMLADVLTKRPDLAEKLEPSFIERLNEASKKASEELESSGKSPLEQLLEDSKPK